MREVVLDTETTGLDPYKGHRIIEIGAVELVNKIQTGNVFHFYVNPERDVPFEAYQIHGISEEFLRDKPKFNEISKEFIEFVSNSPLVIHNAQFDMGFINFELQKIKSPKLDYITIIDTLIIARRKFPGQKNNLDALCKRFKVDNSDRKYHGALKDAYLLAEVYVELTGGRQIKLDVTSALANKDGPSNISRKVFSNDDFKVVQPTEEERRLHEILLKRIKK
jgi:DNA polymerase III subunit epsilon